MDAQHITYTAVHKMNYLVTWNQKHSVNMQKLIQINECIDRFGLQPSHICTPQQHLELQELTDDDES
jgi:hypothetical protein